MAAGEQIFEKGYIYDSKSQDETKYTNEGMLMLEKERNSFPKFEKWVLKTGLPDGYG